MLIVISAFQTNEQLITTLQHYYNIFWYSINRRIAWYIVRSMTNAAITIIF